MSDARTPIVAASPAPWSVSEADPGVVLDADGTPIAVLGGGPQSYRDAAFIVALRNAAVNDHPDEVSNG